MPPDTLSIDPAADANALGQARAMLETAPSGSPITGDPGQADPVPDPDGGEGDPPGDASAAAPWGLKADGSPRAKPGRKPKGEEGEGEPQGDSKRARLRSVGRAPERPQKLPPIKVAAPINPADYEASATTAANIWFNVGEALVGPEWAPDVEKGEHMVVHRAFRDYFKARQMPDIPPGWALVVTLGMYSLSRFNRPTVRPKIERAAERFVLWARKFRFPKRT